MLWPETISSPEEYIAAAEAFAKDELPWRGTMSFDNARCMMMGITSQKMVELAKSLDHPPVAFGTNCTTDAFNIFRIMQGFAAKNPT